MGAGHQGLSIERQLAAGPPPFGDKQSKARPGKLT